MGVLGWNIYKNKHITTKDIFHNALNILIYVNLWVKLVSLSRDYNFKRTDSQNLYKNTE